MTLLEIGCWQFQRRKYVRKKNSHKHGRVPRHSSGGQIEKPDRKHAKNRYLKSPNQMLEQIERGGE
jgi:hypothetical protein